MNIAYVGKGGKANIERHLLPLCLMERIDSLYIIRPGSLDLSSSKIRDHTFRNFGIAFSLPFLLAKSLWVLRCKPVDWIISFNPVPWGFIAWLVAKALRIKVSLGLIGDDFNVHLQSVFGAFWIWVFKHCDAITVPGKKMKDSLIQKGVLENKIHLLPHAVDTSVFTPEEGNKTFDVLYVGDLIPLKNVHVLIEAIPGIKEKVHSIRVGIAGTGPLRASLMKRAEGLDVLENIEFLGYVKEIDKILKRSKTLAICSSREGLPFVLIEAICCGVVPITTNVGAIGEWIVDSKSGLFHENNPYDLSCKVLTVLENPAQYNAMRSECLTMRSRFAVTEAQNEWMEIFSIPQKNEG